MKYKVTNNVEMLNEEFNLEEYNMTNDDYVNDYIDAESEEEAIHTAMDYLSEQIQNNGFDVKVIKMTNLLKNGTISVRKNKYVILILRT